MIDADQGEYTVQIENAPQTGDGRVDDVVAPLATLAELPTSDHVDILDEVHRGLQDALATSTEA